MSDQKTEQTSGETGSLGAGAAVPDASQVQSEAVAAAAPEPASVQSPDLVPEPAGAAEPAMADAPKADAPKADPSKIDASAADTPRLPGKLMIMSAGERAWDGGRAEQAAESGPASGMFGKRRISALVAVAALAAITGALGGALATAGFSHSTGNDSQIASSRALEEQVARLDADLSTVRASIEHTSKIGMVQFNKTSDRLDKIEKAQAEPAAKIAKLSETVEKLRAAPVAATPVAAAAPVAAKEVTGSIAPSVAAAAAPAPATAAKPEVARLPTVDSWVLRDVANGGALIDGRQGIYEVYAGDFIPGLGRIDAIRRQDGRWVVVTSKGLIVAR